MYFFPCVSPRLSRQFHPLELDNDSLLGDKNLPVKCRSNIYIKDVQQGTLSDPNAVSQKKENTGKSPRD